MENGSEETARNRKEGEGRGTANNIETATATQTFFQNVILLRIDEGE
jgi:hypothetical protein